MGVLYAHRNAKQSADKAIEKTEETKMLNQEMRTVTMNRSDMLRVAQALTHVVLGFRDEVRAATTEDRRRSAKCSLDMWERIRSEFDRQMDEQDPEEFRRK